MHILHFFLDYVVSFACLIIVLVFVHELGHFLVARWCGVKVEVFSIGFGKELLGFTDKKGTRWKICPIPLGGYVKMQGEMVPSDQKDLDDCPDSFHNKKLWQKALIVIAGPVFNIIFPLIVFFILYSVIGVSQIKPQIQDIVKDSAAYKVLHKGDTIVSVNNKSVVSFSDVTQIIMPLANKNITLKLLSLKGDTRVVNVKVGSKNIQEQEVGFLGVIANPNNKFTIRYGIIESSLKSWATYKQFVINTLYGFKSIFSKKFTLDSLGGPIKIFQISGNMIENYGFVIWLNLLAALSLNLALINLLPIPGLDGGHLFLYAVQAVTTKSLSIKVQRFMFILGFLVIISLMVLITVNDIVHLFK